VGYEHAAFHRPAPTAVYACCATAAVAGTVKVVPSSAVLETPIVPP
jgi:hypothetical protein